VKQFGSRLNAIHKLLFFAVLLGILSGVEGDTLFSASDPNINYYGRFDYSNPESPQCTWSGSAIEAKFPGPSIGFCLVDGSADYDVEIDGVLDTIIRTDFDIREHQIRDDLSEDFHTIRIIRRSENHYSACTFRGFYLPDGKELAPPPEKPSRKIEFIGDSYTVGYGNESPGRVCDSDQLRAYTNTNRSFATLVTKAFHAQSIILGNSGKGMVRNYGAGDKRSPKPYPYYYDKTCGEVESVAWDFSQWIPDIVVICLGTNDFSTEPHPDDSMYIGDYHKFIDRITGYYPDVSVVCVSTHTGPCVEYVKRVVEEQSSIYGRQNIFYAEFPESLVMDGCDYHPNIADDEAVASVLIENIMGNIGWDTASTSVIISSRNRIERDKKIFSLTYSPGHVKFRLSADFTSEYNIQIINIHGKVLLRKKTTEYCIDLRTDRFPPGIYFVGNFLIGWSQFRLYR
jgi:hypothetical protein